VEIDQIVDQTRDVNPEMSVDAGEADFREEQDFGMERF
jgi:hypothetical protein